MTVVQWHCLQWLYGRETKHHYILSTFNIAQLCSIIAVFYYCKAPILYAQHMHAAPGMLMSTHSGLHVSSPLFI